MHVKLNKKLPSLVLLCEPTQPWASIQKVGYSFQACVSWWNTYKHSHRGSLDTWMKSKCSLIEAERVDDRRSSCRDDWAVIRRRKSCAAWRDKLCVTLSVVNGAHIWQVARNPPHFFSSHLQLLLPAHVSGIRVFCLIVLLDIIRLCNGQNTPVGCGKTRPEHANGCVD